MDYQKIRSNTLIHVKILGYELPADLPLLDDRSALRSTEEIQDRALALHALIAVSYGFNREKALKWINRESLNKALTNDEVNFLNADNHRQDSIKRQVETLYAFAWAFGLFNELDFEKECPNTLVSLYPNLKADETSVGFRKQTVLRSIDDIVAACDLAFVLHWSVNQAAVEGEPVPGKVPPYVIMERRRALEWMLSPEDWDQFSLDT